jgi:methyl-accepting chemotaxis protein
MNWLRNMTIGTRLGTGFGVLVLALCAICVLGVTGTARIGTTADRIINEDWQRAHAAQDLENAAYATFIVALQSLQKTEQTPLTTLLQRVKDERVVMDKAMAELDKLATSDAEKAALGRIGAELKGYMTSMGQVIEHAETGKVVQGEAAVHQVLGPRFGALTAEIKKLVESNEQQVRASFDSQLTAIGAARNTMIVLGVLATLAGIAFAWWVTRSLTGPLSDALGVARRIAAGRLDQGIDVKGRDEVGQLVHALSEMQSDLRGMISEVAHGASDLSGSARRFSGSASESMSRVHTHSETTSATAAAVEQMTVSIGQVAEHAQEAAAIAGRSSDLAAEGEAIVRAASSEMNSIADSVQHGSRLVETLNKRSAQISSIVKVIKDIADQTNLLALNAAIEAARAGEQGRGFAVVADEVRKLAERTGTATSEIGAMIDAIQHETSTVVETMQAGGDKVVHGVKLADDAAAALEKIKAQALETVESVNAIAAATREQQAASTDIARNVERIAQMTEENGRSAGEAADSARQLDELASNLQGRVARFTL